MYLKYFYYVVRHKWFVMIECFKEGVIWRGLVHDLSKLLPDEFIPYARYFYGTYPDFEQAKRILGYYNYKYTKQGIEQSFDYAWLLHQKRNRHHWQWWILPLDDGGNKLINMPNKYILEMICDWKGAGRAINGRKPNEVKIWYENNKKNIILNIDTRKKLELILFYGSKIK